jgi:hypothetical protein
MKVFLQPPQPSLGLDRIAHALRRYAPAGVEVCQFPRNVDLTVIYAIGRRDHIERQCREIKQRDKRYAVIQVCLKSTMSPNVDDWVDIWENAIVVWSYYDLARQFYSAGYDTDGGWRFPQHFFHVPLGVDGQVFYDRFTSPRWDDLPHNERNVTIVTSGHSRLSESVRECWLAAEQVEGTVVHLGPLKPAKHVMSVTNVSDAELAVHYSASQFVSGLRRTEGFELPAAEGLLCGARPVVFDTPDYRWAYKSWAEYIHEGTRAEVVDQLVQLFKQGARPVTAAEREEAAHWFNWERVCGEFWQRCL